jgi:hypothetical protein
VGHARLLKAIGQANPRNGEKKAGYNAGYDVRAGRKLFAIFEHLRRFPSEAGKGRIAAKEAHRDGDAPFRRNNNPVQRELANQSQEKTAREINQQSAVRKCSASADLYKTLQTVASQRANGSENRDEDKLHVCSNPLPSRNKKLLARSRSQESSGPEILAGTVEANSIALKM